MKARIIIVALLISTISYSFAAKADDSIKTGICKLSISKKFKGIFSLSLEEGDYRVTAVQPAAACEKMALEHAQSLKSLPSNAESIISVNYEYEGTVTLNP